MKTQKFKLFVGLLVLSAGFIQPVEAATAVALTDNTGLFVINFDFIAGKEDYRVPIGLIHGLNFGATSSFAGYHIKAGDETISSLTTTNGVTLSKQTIVDGQYYLIEAGKRASFTSVILAEVPEDKTVGQYHAALSHLPYKNGSEKTAVTKDRVEKFSSDSVLLNREISGKLFNLSSEAK